MAVDRSRSMVPSRPPPRFLDPSVNHVIRVAPDVVFALTEANPTGSPTRWRFDCLGRMPARGDPRQYQTLRHRGQASAAPDPGKG